MKIHMHTWERIMFFAPLKAFRCGCGAAMSEHDGYYYYSPRRMFGNVWKWIKRAA